MSLYSRLRGKGPTGFGYGTTAAEVVSGLDLSGKTILITGCNSGLGLESARVLAAAGAKIIGTARSQDKGSRALSALGDGHIALVCELSEPSSIRACVQQVIAGGHKLDAIIANAGIMALPKRRVHHGFELQFLTNHLGHFILTTELLEQLSEDGRVVMLSSDAHRRAPRAGIEFDNLDGAKSYSGWSAYGQSKLANLLHATKLAQQFRDTQRSAFSVHPGVIATNLGRHLLKPLQVAFKGLSPLVLKNEAQGAATQVFAAVHPGAVAYSGSYLSDCNVGRPSKVALNDDLADRLWNESLRITRALS